MNSLQDDKEERLYNIVEISDKFKIWRAEKSFLHDTRLKTRIYKIWCYAQKYFYKFYKTSYTNA